jgi:hypothetical protein
LLLGFSMMVVTRAAVQRRLLEPELLRAWARSVVVARAARAAAGDGRAEKLPRRPAYRRPWWWTRVAGGAMWGLGMLSLTASASFSATATVNQGALTAGHMELEVPAAGATNRLTLGATGLVPGDLMMRALDLNVSADTTAGIIDHVELGIEASPSSALDGDAVNGLQIWIEKCSTDWTESGSTPAFSYTCSGGTRSDVLGSTSAHALPSAGTCPPPDGTVSSLNSLTVIPETLTNITTTAGASNNLVVFMCFPNSADNQWQDESSTLTFTFSGVQRAGTNK